ncbi:MAG: hypothetical protein DMD33_16110 [Gemmatimonadetes bacterium]|nr:MAG: hypothetical protein DMD33_16110 [Gemmatimonadota bacterium]
MRTARSLLCTLVVIPLRLTAQAEPTTAPGDRVRVVAPVVSKASLTGTIVSRGADTLWLEVEDRPAPLAIPFTAIQRLEASRGRHSNVLTGLLVGLGVGAAGGAIGGAACGESFLCPGPGAGAVVGALALSIPGLVIGALTHSERWESVPLNRVSLSAVRGTAGVMLALTLQIP